MASKTVKVYEVLFVVDDNHPSAYGGAMGDGSFIQRFRKLADAEAFARGKRSYSGDAKIHESEVPRRLAQRWGVA